MASEQPAGARGGREVGDLGTAPAAGEALVGQACLRLTGLGGRADCHAESL
jgi:hypothetical protein